VTHITALEDVSGLWRDKSREICEAFYSCIADNCEDYIIGLEKALDMPDVIVNDVRKGSILTASVQCGTLGALESINQMYKSRRLASLCQAVFTNEQTLTNIGVKNLALDLSIDPDELEDCRDYLLSRKFKESTVFHPTDTLSIPHAEEPNIDRIPKLRGASFVMSIFEYLIGVKSSIIWFLSFQRNRRETALPCLKAKHISLQNWKI
jgi:hypothetical protein